ncbi:MAG: hypothetical protein ACRCVJ_12405 [Clostridium sp.]|uniref:hypothetical protein n=1 Tax=Clostridium sp. TaxID=1506 RepID=UPI003F337F8F
MRIRNKKVYYLKAKEVIEDDEGGKYEGFLKEGIKIEANIYPATGKLQGEIYGERLKYILNMLYDGKNEIKEGDGVCVYVSKESNPDYRVISSKRYSHMTIELEKI